MKITYINHSGFLVETENCYYVFDYYKGEMPSLDKSKEVVVFCSMILSIMVYTFNSYKEDSYAAIGKAA